MQYIYTFLIVLILQHKKDLAPFYTELNPLLKLTMTVIQKLENHHMLFKTNSYYDNLFTLRLSTL